MFDLAVMIPIESTDLTSLYVSSPPTVIFPSTSKPSAVTVPVNTAAPLLYIVAPAPIGVSAPKEFIAAASIPTPVSYTHLRAHET